MKVQKVREDSVNSLKGMLHYAPLRGGMKK